MKVELMKFASPVYFQNLVRSCQHIGGTPCIYSQISHVESRYRGNRIKIYWELRGGWVIRNQSQGKGKCFEQSHEARNA